MPYGPSSSLATPADPAVAQRRQPLLAHAAENARPLALVYRIIAFALILAGVVRNSGVLSGAPDWSTLLFYTMISNLLCLGWMLLLIIRTARDLRRLGTSGTSTPNARGSGAVMMAISVTMLIYLIVLVPTRFQQGDADIFSLTDNLIHIITPCLVIGDWLLFVPKGTFRWIDPLRWTLIPYAYLVFGFIYGALGGEFTPGQTYPYPFMNTEKLGLGGVALWIVALSATLVAVGFLFVAIDRMLGAAGRHIAL
ncbi:Pr6Pr family membrane protein [Microbacterium sp.]|uniref:Pr6Pr family membrane protein n=1 Tax=Microbacterium sp. TaxID=51671 RepID=UPI003563BE58